MGGAPELCHAQYYPRGVRFNDNFLPNLEEPDKFFLTLDSLIDMRSEKQSSGNTRWEDSHFHGQMLYGGQQFRGGLLVSQDNYQGDIRDLTLGFNLSFRRPVFFEVGAGLLTRSQSTQTDDGYTVTARIGYGIRIVHNISYRIRLRVSASYIYKSLNTNTGNLTATQFFPMVGLEFET